MITLHLLDNTTQVETIIAILSDPAKFFIGVKPSYGSKCFISRDKYLRGKYRVRALNELTVGNGWEGAHEDLGELLYVLLQRTFKVYVFNSQESFLSWLSQKEEESKC